MNGLSLFWSQFFLWLPPALQSVLLAFVVITVIILALKVLAFVLDIIPFV